METKNEKPVPFWEAFGYEEAYFKKQIDRVEFLIAEMVLKCKDDLQDTDVVKGILDLPDMPTDVRGWILYCIGKRKGRDNYIEDQQNGFKVLAKLFSIGNEDKI